MIETDRFLCVIRLYFHQERFLIKHAATLCHTYLFTSANNIGMPSDVSLILISEVIEYDQEMPQIL